MAKAKKKKTGLGGTSLDWIKDTTGATNASLLREVPLEDIVESERLKLRLDLPDIKGLAADIEKRGQTTPAFVRLLPDGKYELISGYRRLAATRELGRETLLVRVFPELTDEETEQLAISENLQRQDLSDLEQARICLRLQEQGLEVKQIGEAMGKKVRTISLYLAVAKAPSKICDALHKGKLSLYAANELAQACGKEETAYVCRPERNLAKVIKHIVDEELSVRQVREYLEQFAEGDEVEPEDELEPEDEVEPEDEDEVIEEQPSVARKKSRGPFQPVRFSESKKGFDLVVKYRRREDVVAIIEQLEETLERMRSELAAGEEE